MKVLYVEDSGPLRRAIQSGLKKAGFAVDVSADGEEGLWLAESIEYDVIVLDWMLPGLDGLAIVKRLREAGRETPVLFLTVRDAVSDRVDGLMSGADDYLVKPFAFEELVARIQVLARRKFGVRSPRITVEDLTIDTSSKRVFRGKEEIVLTPREYRLLEYLAVRRGVVVSRQEIEAHLYDDLSEPMSNVVDSFIYKLRRKLQGGGGPPLLHTRRGMGYLLGDPSS